MVVPQKAGMGSDDQCNNSSDSFCEGDVRLTTTLTHKPAKELRRTYSEQGVHSISVQEESFFISEYLNAMVPDSLDVRAITYPTASKPRLNHWEASCNLMLCLNSARALGCSLVSIGTEDIQQGKKHLILGLIWQIIKTGLIQTINVRAFPMLEALVEKEGCGAELASASPQALLLRWLCHHLKHAGWRRPMPTNLAGDLADAEAFLVLVCRLFPDAAQDAAQEAPLPSDAGPCDKAQCVLLVCQHGDVNCPVMAVDLTSGNERLNTVFLAHLFHKRHGLDLPDSCDHFAFGKLFNSDGKYEREERTLRGWVNSLGCSTYCSYLFSDGISNGWLLLEVLDKLQPGIVTWAKAARPPFKPLLRKLSAVQNCNQVVALCSDALQLRLVNVSGEDLAACHQLAILGLMWQLMRFHVMQMLAALYQRLCSSSNNSGWQLSRVSSSDSAAADLSAMMLTSGLALSPAPSWASDDGFAKTDRGSLELSPATSGRTDALQDCIAKALSHDMGLSRMAADGVQLCVNQPGHAGEDAHDASTTQYKGQGSQCGHERQATLAQQQLITPRSRGGIDQVQPYNGSVGDDRPLRQHQDYSAQVDQAASAGHSSQARPEQVASAGHSDQQESILNRPPQSSPRNLQPSSAGEQDAASPSDVHDSRRGQLHWAASASQDQRPSWARAREGDNASEGCRPSWVRQHANSPAGAEEQPAALNQDGQAGVSAPRWSVPKQRDRERKDTDSPRDNTPAAPLTPAVVLKMWQSRAGSGNSPGWSQASASPGAAPGSPAASLPAAAVPSSSDALAPTADVTGPSATTPQLASGTRSLTRQWTTGSARAPAPLLITDKDIIAWANDRLAAAGSTHRLRSFREASLATGRLLLDLVGAVAPSLVNPQHVRSGESEEDRRANAQYVISLARKLGCSVFLVWEDIVEVKSRMLGVMVASVMQADLQRQALEGLSVSPDSLNLTGLV